MKEGKLQPRFAKPQSLTTVYEFLVTAPQPQKRLQILDMFFCSPSFSEMPG
jgi:hypothetical protein